MDNCIFCKVIKKEIEAEFVYEDKNVVAFEDINPVNLGHTLVIPKNHFENIFDIPEGVLSNIYIIVKKLSRAVRDGFKCDGITVAQSNGKASNQEIMHFHTHIIPRYVDDRATLGWRRLKVNEDDLKVSAQKIIGALK